MSEYRKFRVGYYLNMDREETYDYFDEETEAYDHFITKRQEGETWLEALTETGDEYDTTESYYPEDDEDEYPTCDNCGNERHRFYLHDLSDRFGETWCDHCINYWNDQHPNEQI